jgi:hypothetical protein
MKGTTNENLMKRKANADLMKGTTNVNLTEIIHKQ